jgi:hypothetical protein
MHATIRLGATVIALAVSPAPALAAASDEAAAEKAKRAGAITVIHDSQGHRIA